MSTRIITSYEDLDRNLGHYRDGRANRHLLITGRPGCGKTVHLRRHFRDSLPDAPADPLFESDTTRRSVPIYTGRLSPAKAYIWAWVHRDEPLVVYNDVAIAAGDGGWKWLLHQLLEQPGARPIRWEIRTPIEPNEADLARIAAIVRARSGRSGLADLALDEVPNVVPHSFTCTSTYLIVANDLGRGWDAVSSRLTHLDFRPIVEALIEELATWCHDAEILGFIRERHRRGEVLNLDFRDIDTAMEDKRLGEPWREVLEAGFAAEIDVRTIEDAAAILKAVEALHASGIPVERGVTMHEVYDRVQGLRPDRPGGMVRRGNALRFLADRGDIRIEPPSRGVGQRRPRGPIIHRLRPDVAD